MSRGIAIAIAVVEASGQYLVGQRPGVALAGLWEFPGGKVESGEVAAAAAVRECREETGLDVRVLDEYPTHRQDYPHGQLELHFFACRPVDAQQEPALPYRWVEKDELNRLQFPEGNRDLIQHLLKK
jgi:8-oxo-dGTP diphosphatase